MGIVDGIVDGIVSSWGGDVVGVTNTREEGVVGIDVRVVECLDRCSKRSVQEKGSDWRDWNIGQQRDHPWSWKAGFGQVIKCLLELGWGDELLRRTCWSDLG